MADTPEWLAAKDALAEDLGVLTKRAYAVFCLQLNDSAQRAVAAIATALLQECATMMRVHGETRTTFLSLAAECWDAVEKVARGRN